MYGIIERYVSTTTCAIKTLNEKKKMPKCTSMVLSVFIEYKLFRISLLLYMYTGKYSQSYFFYLPLRPELANIRLGEFNS